jgi:hypothetical protein
MRKRKHMKHLLNREGNNKINKGSSDSLKIGREIKRNRIHNGRMN